MHVTDKRLVEVQKAAMDDEEQKVVLVQGWPNQVKDVPAQAQKYWNFKESLVYQDGVLYKWEQVVVPQSLKADYLQRLHTSHVG